MLDASLLKTATDTLVAALQTSLNGLAPTLGLSGILVQGAGPTTILRTATEEALSVFLFRVDLEEAPRHRPPVPLPGSTEPPDAPLVNLRYLLTPFALQHANDPLLLGAVLRVLQEQPVLPLAPGSERSLRIEFSPLSIADTALLWESLGTPYRLSVTYQVRVV